MIGELLSTTILRRCIFLIGLNLFIAYQTFGIDQTNSKGDDIFDLGDSCYYEGNYLESIVFYRIALKIYRESQDSLNISKALNDIGVSFRKMGEFDSAKSYYERAIVLDTHRKDTLGIVNRYFNLSNLYNDQGNYSLASQLLIEALTMAQRNNYVKSVANLKSALGNLYANQDDFTIALDYHHMAKRDYQNLRDSARYGLVLNNIGNCFIELEQWDSAYYYLHESLRIKKLSTNSNSIAFTLHNLGNMFRLKEEFDSSEYYLWQAYNVRKEIADSYGMAFTGNELGQLYLSMGEPSEAITFLLEARKYAETERNYTILIDNIDVLHDYYLIIGDTVQAYQALNEWAILKDSLYNQEKVKVLELRSAFDLNRKEEERQQQEKKALSQSRLAEQRLTVIGIVTGAALILVVLILFVVRQRVRIKRLNENLKLINRDMYHRKKNDYMRLLNEISAVNVPISEEIRGQLLASAAVDESLYEEKYDKVELSDYLEERLEDISDAQGFASKGVDLEFSITRVHISGQKASALLLVLNELLTNSLKHSFAEQGGTIHITIADVDDRLKVLFKDDGAPFPTSRKGHGMGQQIIQQILKTLRSELIREVEDNWNLSSFEIKVS